MPMTTSDHGTLEQVDDEYWRLQFTRRLGFQLVG